MHLSSADVLPADHDNAVLVGRVWVEANREAIAGPRIVRVSGENLIDLSGLVPTMSDLLDLTDCARQARNHVGPVIGHLNNVLANKSLLAPCDLQAIKAAGVTFSASAIERVIEERARGDAKQADILRSELETALGSSLRHIVPGSPAATTVKKILTRNGQWSQYLEVAIGPDPEIFTKAQPMSAVGCGAEIGLHSRSEWNNPEAEIVLAVSSQGKIVGATLGNDVNLRDFEGRSALLLGMAKDNNASCAIGPFIRLFDENYSMACDEQDVLELTIKGTDGFELTGEGAISAITRKPSALVEAASGTQHQYPDGFLLFLGAAYVPKTDRFETGMGFTHAEGDHVTIRSNQLGSLHNTVTRSNHAPPWTYGTRALMRSLAARGLLETKGSEHTS